MKTERKLFSASELVLVASGLLFLTSTLILAPGGSFSVWFAAKALYAAGVIFFLFYSV